MKPCFYNLSNLIIVHTFYTNWIFRSSLRKSAQRDAPDQHRFSHRGKFIYAQNAVHRVLFFIRGHCGKFTTPQPNGRIIIAASLYAPAGSDSLTSHALDLLQEWTGLR